MKKKKILILLFTLSFPVILYLFLRSYGENEFALPVFFDDEEKLYCTEKGTGQDSVQIFKLNLQDSFQLNDIYSADFKVIHFPVAEDSEIQTLKNELNRILNTFRELSVNIISLKAITSQVEKQTGIERFLDYERAKTFVYSEAHKEKLVNCVYAFPTKEWNGQHPTEEVIPIENTLVLLDEANRIRGYYNGYETKEVDRLILEIRVLLSNQ